MSQHLDIEARMSEGQRLAKVLEDAGIKIDSVAATLLGGSGPAAAPFELVIAQLMTILTPVAEGLGEAGLHGIGDGRRADQGHGYELVQNPYPRP